MTEEPKSKDTTDLPAAVEGADFVQLFTKHQRRLYRYILAQVPTPVEAEEILQETTLVIWRKFSGFEPGSNFLAWGAQIARFEVLKYLERRRRDRVRFSREFLDVVAEEALTESPDLERRRQALMTCLGKLRPRDRELIQRRYASGESGLSVARLLNRPANSIYQSLGRIRRALLECINRQLAAESSP